MKQLIRNAVIATIAAFAITILAMIIVNGSSNSENTNSVNNNFERRIRNDFMSGCTKDDYSNYQYCNCTYNYFNGRMTTSQLIDFATITEDMSDDQLLEYSVVRGAIKECSHFINN